MPPRLPGHQAVFDGSFRSASEDVSVGFHAQSGEKRKRGQPKKQGACVHCKSLKVRCEFSLGETRCRRCITSGQDCQARTRKKRKDAPTQEDLQARSRQQDEQLQSLLRQFDQLKLDKKVETWVHRASMTRPVQRNPGEIAQPVPILTCHYYSALIGPLKIDLSPHNPDHYKLPLVVRTGILAAYEVHDLFNLFFERINPFFACLDGEIHCPQNLIWVNELLFTTMCALASRHYIRRPGLYDVLMDIALDLAGEALTTGYQSVESVQAFLLLAVYPIPQKKWAEDRSWLYIGVAIRMAQELQLDKAPTGADERDNVNRLRTWLFCFTADLSHATQFGKTAMLNGDHRQLVYDTTRKLYKFSTCSPYDIGLGAYAELCLLMGEFQESLNPGVVSGEGMELDVVSMAVTYDKRFHELSAYWTQQLEADPNVAVCPVVRYRFHNFSLLSSYMRLVVLSQGFQHCVKHGISRDSYIFRQSIEVSQRALWTVFDKLYPSYLLGWAMEANFLYMAFSAAFLLNLLRPKFLPLLDLSQCATIVTLVSRLISVLSSEDVALDGRHSPAVYSKFLSTLLRKYYTPSLEQNIRHASPEIMPLYHENREQTPPYIYYWPDIPSSMDNLDKSIADGHGSPSQHMVRQEVGELEMDFSPQHFIRSTGIAPLSEPPILYSPQSGSAQW